MKQILLIEDHPVVAEATEAMLVQLGVALAVTKCSTAGDALARLSEPERDWSRVFLDLDVPGAIGLSLARHIEKQGLAARCCVVTGNAAPEYVEAIRESGFLGYIVKSMSALAFQRAIHTAVLGERTFPAIERHRLPHIRLTKRQTEMLDLVRQGLSSKCIAATVHIAEGTVNNHIAAILHTFGAATRAQAVAKAIEFGLLQAPTAAPRQAG